MKRAVSISAVLLLATGCGELTNEDLLFLAAVPTPEELQLVVDESTAAAQGQSLQQRSAQSVGEPSGTYDALASLALDLNTHVEFILDFVNELGRGAQPTLREEDRRIWGPFRDGGGPLLRLEIARAFSGDKPEYTFCLHVAQPGATSGDPECSAQRDVADDSNGWRAYLYGSFSPLNAVEGARTGDGVFTLDFEAAREVGVSLGPGDEGRFSFEYAFAEGGVSKDLDVIFTPRDEPIPGFPDLYWSYSLARSGDVRLYVEFPENAEDTDPAVLELNQIDSCWNLDSAGRATFTFSEGDIPAAATVQGTECWDSARRRTYFRIQLDGTVLEVGDAAACPAACQ